MEVLTSVLRQGIKKKSENWKGKKAVVIHKWYDDELRKSKRILEWLLKLIGIEIISKNARQIHIHTTVVLHTNKKRERIDFFKDDIYNCFWKSSAHEWSQTKTNMVSLKCGI